MWLGNQICHAWRLGRQNITGLIPQSLQLQAQVTLASLGSCYKSGRVHEVVCAYIGVFLESERWWCQNSSAYVVTAIMLLGQEYNPACENRAGGYHAKWRGFRGCNSAILLHERFSFSGFDKIISSNIHAIREWSDEVTDMVVMTALKLDLQVFALC